MSVPEHPAAGPSDSVVALQRDASENGLVAKPGGQRRLASDLAEFETLAEAEYLERLAADADLVVVPWDVVDIR